MGTPQVVSFTAHGAEHELVFTGVAPKLDLARIADDVRRICETQIAFFEPRTRHAPFLDSADRYVFMTMVTNDGYGGLEHRASTALMTARKDLPVLGQQARAKAIAASWAWSAMNTSTPGTSSASSPPPSRPTICRSPT